MAIPKSKIIRHLSQDPILKTLVENIPFPKLEVQ